MIKWSGKFGRGKIKGQKYTAFISFLPLTFYFVYA